MHAAQANGDPLSQVTFQTSILPLTQSYSISRYLKVVEQVSSKYVLSAAKTHHGFPKHLTPRHFIMKTLNYQLFRAEKRQKIEK